MKVLNDFVLVSKEVVETEKAASGLLLSSSNIEDMLYQEGKVVDKSPLLSFDLEIGSIIVFDKSRAHTVKLDGVFYRLIREKDVALIL